MRACRDAGLLVPGDISIIGAGSVEHDYLPDPFMTTLRWDRGEMGRDAGHMLLKLIAGETLPKNHVVKRPTLVVHRSTALL